MNQYSDDPERNENEEPLELVRMLFGEQAEKASSTASAQLTTWAEAFENWLSEGEQQYGVKKRKDWALAWRGFLQHANKVPWDVVSGDVKSWVSELVGLKLRPNTIYHKLIALERFYDHCTKLGIETVSSPNPVRGVKRPRYVPRPGLSALSPEEARALLGAIDRETSLVAKRDYALLLMHLTTGLESDHIRKLRWEEIQPNEEATHCYTGKDKRLKVAIPGNTWQAVQEYLEASGRSGEMEAKDYVFAPVVDALNRQPSGKAEDWNRGRPLSRDQMHFLLKRYAGWAGFKPDEVTYHCLRHTALMLRVEAGDERNELRSFMLGMGDQPIRKIMRTSCEGGRKMLTQEERSSGESRGPYQRGKSKAQPGNQIALKHGMYARRLPDELAALVEETPVQGLEKEIQIIRAVLRRVFQLIMETDKPEECSSWLELYATTAARLANMIRVQKDLEVQQPENSELGDILRRIAEEVSGQKASEDEAADEM